MTAVVPFVQETNPRATVSKAVDYALGSCISQLAILRRTNSFAGDQFYSVYLSPVGKKHFSSIIKSKLKNLEWLLKELGFKFNATYNEVAGVQKYKLELPRSLNPQVFEKEGKENRTARTDRLCEVIAKIMDLSPIISRKDLFHHVDESDHSATIAQIEAAIRRCVTNGVIGRLDTYVETGTSETKPEYKSSPFYISAKLLIPMRDAKAHWPLIMMLERVIEKPVKKRSVRMSSVNGRPRVLAERHREISARSRTRRS